MKANELRIGNLVYGINRRSEVHIPNEFPLKVWQIEIFNCEVLPADKNPAEAESYLKISNVDITGIPLTEDWLLKFGFTYDADNCWLTIIKTGEFAFSLNDMRWSYEWGEWFPVKIEYVHQLQNLYFALTGTELTITPSPG